MAKQDENDHRPFAWLDADEVDADTVLRRLLSDAAEVVPGLSSDPNLTDPLARLFLGAVSREYARLYHRLDDVVGLAYRRLVSQMLSFPRAARPSSTVVRLRSAQKGLTVDPALRVIGRKAIATEAGPQETNISFSPLEETSIAGLGGCVVLLDRGDGRVSRIGDVGDPMLGAVPAGPTWECAQSTGARLLIGLDVAPQDQIDQVALFLDGNESLRDAVVWSRWTAGTGGDSLIPGEHERLGPWHGDDSTEMLRSRSDRSIPSSPYDRGLVHLERSWLESGRGQLPEAAEAGIHAGQLPSAPNRLWIQVHLDTEDDPGAFASIRVHPDCVIVWNVDDATILVSGGTEPDQLAPLKRDYRSIFRIDEVRDGMNAVIFAPVDLEGGLTAENRYYLDSDTKDKAVIRLVSEKSASRPRSIEVDLLETLAAQANELDPGSISIIHDRSVCPGVTDAVNVVASAGGEAAASLPQHGEELRSAMATRGRAVTRSDFARLAQQFDPARIESVRVGRGVARRARGVVPSVDVEIRSKSESLRTEPQRRAFEAELHDHLQSRAAAGTAVRVTVRQEPRGGDENGAMRAGKNEPSA